MADYPCDCSQIGPQWTQSWRLERVIWGKLLFTSFVIVAIALCACECKCLYLNFYTICPSLSVLDFLRCFHALLIVNSAHHSEMKCSVWKSHFVSCHLSIFFFQISHTSQLYSSTVTVFPSRSAGSSSFFFSKKVLQEYHKECEVFIWSPISSDTNLMSPDGICGKQSQSTETPYHNQHGPNIYCKLHRVMEVCWSLSQQSIFCSPVTVDGCPI